MHWLTVLQRFIAAKILMLDATRATPAERFNDGRDFVPTDKWVVFATISRRSRARTLIGPTLAAQFGYLPGTLWILVGAVLGGCVQDFVTLTFSIRRDGRSLDKWRATNWGRWANRRAAGVMAIMVILIECSAWW